MRTTTVTVNRLEEKNQKRHGVLEDKEQTYNESVTIEEAERKYEETPHARKTRQELSQSCDENGTRDPCLDEEDFIQREELIDENQARVCTWNINTINLI